MKKTKKYLALLLVLVLAGAVGAAYKLYSERLHFLDHHGFRHEPAAEFDHALGFRLKKSVSMNGFRHNALGFIGPEIQQRKPDGTYRIFCLGGSTTLGAGVETDVHAYPAILQALFDKTPAGAAKRIEVINAGVFGYRSLHTARLVSRLLDDYQPDMFIVMDGLNDLDAAKALTLPQLRKAAGKAGNGQAEGYGLQSIEEKFELVGYRDNIRTVIDQARARGVQVVLVSDPMRVGADGKAQLSGDNTEFAALLAFGRTVLPEINASLAHTGGVPFVNAQATFDAMLASPEAVRRAWADDLHLTRYGYYLLARDVYLRLLAMPGFVEAVGAGSPPVPWELDAQFPELVLWRPSDGMGWAKDRDAIQNGGITAVNARDSKPNGDGWSCFTPADAAFPGEIDLGSAAAGRLRVYPRIQGARDSVGVYHVLPGGERTLLFEQRKPAEDGLWTPETAWYEVEIPPCRECRIVVRLTGGNAQLWHKAGAVLFAPK
ncbi:MAG: SGNH/GDSL hydrolase family protein [Acidobacteriota bacterium]